MGVLKLSILESIFDEIFLVHCTTFSGGGRGNYTGLSDSKKEVIVFCSISWYQF